MVKLPSVVILSPAVPVSLVKLTVGASAVLSTVKLSAVVAEMLPATSI